MYYIAICGLREVVVTNCFSSLSNAGQTSKFKLTNQLSLKPQNGQELTICTENFLPVSYFVYNKELTRSSTVYAENDSRFLYTLKL